MATLVPLIDHIEYIRHKQGNAEKKQDYRTIDKDESEESILELTIHNWVLPTFNPSCHDTSLPALIIVHQLLF
jgi:hypothetical protein